MYIDTVPNRNSPPAILLRECWREGKIIRKKTVANMTKWPPHIVEVVRRAIKGEKLVAVGDVFAIERSLPHGHVQAVLLMIRRLGLESIIATKKSRQRNLVIAMIAQRLIRPYSKLATTRHWHDTTLAGEMAVEEADVDELYSAMAWLLKRQKRIENKLAKRHLADGDCALYDVSGSYYEGRTCPLAFFGYSRDHRSDRPQIVYGVMTDKDGRPVSVDVYPGNTGDPTTVPDQIDKIRNRFGFSRIVFVGDRGMLTQTRIDAIKKHPGIGWISALRSDAIRRLVGAGAIQMELFDEQNLAEITSPDFPGERLMVCFNPDLAAERSRKRDELLAVTEKALKKIEREAARRKKKIMTIEEIAMKVGKVIGRRKMKKHFVTNIENGRLEWSHNEESIEKEKALDGIYVIRTSETKESFSAADTVRSYKSLSQVERVFRTLKGLDLRIRPINHRLSDTVRAHVFLCLLSYYVEWHMRRALAPLLFDDEELEVNRASRDPVAAAEPSQSAKQKKGWRSISDGFAVHSFGTLIEHLSTLCKNHCYLRNIPQAKTRIEIATTPTPLQARAFELLEMYPVSGSSNWG